MPRIAVSSCFAALLALLPSIAAGEILAMINYETKSPESLKALKSPVAAPARKEGIAIIDVDPASRNFGKIVQDIPLPGDLVAHHIFYNRDRSKAYVTALGKEELRVIDMKKTAVRHQQSRGGAGLQRRRRRGLLRRRKALVPELHGHAGHGRRRREKGRAY